MPKGVPNRKRRPTHPGELLREDILPAADINQTQLADLLGVSRRTVNEIIQERRFHLVSTWRRLSRIFGNSPQFWLNLQTAVDLWDTTKAKAVGVFEDQAASRSLEVEAMH